MDGKNDQKYEIRRVSLLGKKRWFAETKLIEFWVAWKLCDFRDSLKQVSLWPSQHPLARTTYPDPHTDGQTKTLLERAGIYLQLVMLRAYLKHFMKSGRAYQEIALRPITPLTGCFDYWPTERDLAGRRTSRAQLWTGRAGTLALEQRTGRAGGLPCWD